MQHHDALADHWSARDELRDRCCDGPREDLSVRNTCRVDRHGEAAVRLGLDYLLASSALPFIFPAVKLHREYFGDGSMRQIAPVSPALHLGADRVVVVGTARVRDDDAERTRGDSYPTLAQVAGHVMNSIFLDSLAVDIERLERINRTVAAIPPERLRRAGIALHHVDVLVLTPSEPLDTIAVRHLRSLPGTIRFLLRSVGAMRRGGANLASYLLFEQGYCRELIALGYRDTMKRREEVEAFLQGAMCPVPGAYARTVKFFVPQEDTPRSGEG